LAIRVNYIGFFYGRNVVDFPDFLYDIPVGLYVSWEKWSGSDTVVKRTQGVTPKDVAVHAMSSIDQAFEQARDGNAQFVAEFIASGELGDAGHGV
jgi:hypothetical protein